MKPLSVIQFLALQFMLLIWIVVRDTYQFFVKLMKGIWYLMVAIFSPGKKK